MAKMSCRWTVLLLQSGICWHSVLAADTVLEDPTFLVAIILGAMTLAILVVLVVIVMKYRHLQKRFDQLKESAPEPTACQHCGAHAQAAIPQRSHSADFIDRAGLSLRNYEESAYAVCQTRRVQSLPRGLNNPSFGVSERSAITAPKHTYPASSRPPIFPSTAYYPKPQHGTVPSGQRLTSPQESHWKKHGMSLQTSPIMKRKFAGSLIKRQKSLPALEVASDAVLNELYPTSGNSSMASNGEDIRQRMMQLGAPQPLDSSSSSAAILTQMRQRVGDAGLAGEVPSLGSHAADRTTEQLLQRRYLARDPAGTASPPPLPPTMLHSSTSPPPILASVPYMYRASSENGMYPSRARSLENLPYTTAAFQPSQSNRPRSREATSPTAVSGRDSTDDQNEKAQDEPFFVPLSRQFPTVLHSLEEEPRPIQSSRTMLPLHSRSNEARFLEASSYMSYASSAGRTVDTVSTGVGSDGMSTDAGFSTEDQMTDRMAARDMLQRRKKRSVRRRSQENLPGLFPAKPLHQRVTFLQRQVRGSGVAISSPDAGGVDAVFGASGAAAPLMYTDFSDSDIPHFSSAAASVISTYDVPLTPAVPAVTGRMKSSEVHVYDTPIEPAQPLALPPAQVNGTGVSWSKQSPGGVQLSAGRGVGVDMDGSSVLLHPGQHLYQHSNLSSAQSSFQFTPGTCEVKLAS